MCFCLKVTKQLRGGFPGGTKPKRSLADTDTWKRLLQTGGCENADDVVRAFRCIVEAGAKGKAIPASDILAVRGCGQKLVENLRQKALRVRQLWDFLCLRQALLSWLPTLCLSLSLKLRALGILPWVGRVLGSLQMYRISCILTQCT